MAVKISTCSLCQTIWTRGLPARDSSSITGLALDKSFPESLYYHGVILKRPRDRQHGDINPDPPATVQLQNAIIRKPYGLVPFFGYSSYSSLLVKLYSVRGMTPALSLRCTSSKRLPTDWCTASLRIFTLLHDQPKSVG